MPLSSDGSFCIDLRNGCVKEGFDSPLRFKIYSSLLLRETRLDASPRGICSFVVIINLIGHFMGSGAVSKNGGVLSFFRSDIYFTLVFSFLSLFWVLVPFLLSL